ncbi:MAG: ABC transporter ATP-binding protein [Candidatus Schekmanbacteria bacterium]|nr:ABC transporter ATP-binding protein [Candidatus Schekmanbacteria bacterium]
MSEAGRHRDDHRLVRVTIEFLSTVAGYGGRRVAWWLALTMASAVTEGIGLVLLVPLLELTGVTGGGPGSARSSALTPLFELAGMRASLPNVLALFVALVALRGLLLRAEAVAGGRIQIGLTEHLSRRYYAALASASWRYFLRSRQSDFVQTLTSDVRRIGHGTSLLLRVIVESSMLIIYGATACSLSPAMAALAAIGAGLLLVLQRAGISRSELFGSKLSSSDRILYGTVTDHLAGMRLTKSFGAEKRTLDSFRSALAEISGTQLAFQANNATAGMVSSISGAALLALLVWFAFATLQTSPSRVLVLIFIFTRILPRTTNLQRDLHLLAHCLPAFASYSRALQEASGMAEPRSVSAAAEAAPLLLEEELRAEGISFSYDPGTPGAVLDEASFTLPAGSFTVIVGESGAGKSTLADLLMGLLVPDSGRILVDGRPLVAERVASWRAGLGYVPQETFLSHDTIRANLRWASPDATDEEIWESLDRAAAADFVRQLPAGQDSVVGDRGSRLSGGERQRLALARALLRRPRLLILDEATSALDVDSERKILDAVRLLRGRMTVVFITHRVHFLREADQILSIQGGKAITVGAPQVVSQA